MQLEVSDRIRLCVYISTLQWKSATLQANSRIYMYVDYTPVICGASCWCKFVSGNEEKTEIG